MVLLELEVEQGGQALRGFQDDVAAVPAVAAVGATVRDVFLPAEAPAPVPAVPGLHVDFDLINEIHSVLPCHSAYSCHSERSEESQFAGPVAEQPRRAHAPFTVAAPPTRLQAPSAPPGRPLGATRSFPLSLAPCGRGQGEG